ncbi:MAG: ACT domain-containing protein [Clostridiales Family XIII bacterium]|nr:ACT domain-containing protein [Clostridiales Family XIII bacterium]
MDQVSVFVENKPGALSEITGALAEAGIDLKAFTVADTSEFGILRFLSDAPKKALALLKMAGWVASLTPVVAVKMSDEPGSLAKVLKLFAEADVQVEYMYAFVAQEEGQAYVVFRVADPDGAVALLESSGAITVASIAK